MAISELSKAFAPPFEQDYAGDTNPHYFTADVGDNGELIFVQGSRPSVTLPVLAIKALINGDDFYRNTSKLIKIAQNPDEFAYELNKLLAESGRFARIESVSFENGVFEARFSLNLSKLDLVVGEFSKSRYIYKDYDFLATASPYNLDFQSIFDAAAANYDSAYTNAHYAPKLDD